MNLNLNLIVLGLYCIGSGFVAWAAFKFFTRPDGKIESAMAWLTRLSYVGGAVQVADLIRADASSVARSLAAIAMFLLGYVLFWWAVAVHRRRPPSLAYSKDSPQLLVTSGPYSVVRHPFYTSYMCAWYAPYVATGRLTSLGVALVMTVFFEVAARQEERKFLDSGLSGEYGRYLAQTGRFLPNPWKILRGVFGRRLNA